MKKIISALIICAMFCVTLLAMVPVSAADAVTREDLKEKIDLAESLDKEKYTNASWSSVASALETAKATYDKDNSSSIKIRMAYEGLDNALNSLVVDTAELDALISKADKLMEDDRNVQKFGYEEGDYTADSRNAFKTVLEEARTAKTSNDVEAVDAATASLGEAFDKLVRNTVPSSVAKKLADLMEHADYLIPSDFSDSAWKMVELKVKQGKEAPNDMRVSVYVKAMTELETALKNLTEDKKNIPPLPTLDYQNIDKLIKYVDDNFTPSMFTEDSWNNLKKAYDEAKTIRETTKRQSELDAAYEKLNNARKSLVVAPLPVDSGSSSTDANNQNSDQGGCNSFVGVSVAVVAAVCVLGTAVILKKKD